MGRGARLRGGFKSGAAAAWHACPHFCTPLRPSTTVRPLFVVWICRHGRRGGGDLGGVMQQGKRTREGEKEAVCDGDFPSAPPRVISLSLSLSLSLSGVVFLLPLHSFPPL